MFKPNTRQVRLFVHQLHLLILVGCGQRLGHDSFLTRTPQ